MKKRINSPRRYGRHLPKIVRWSVETSKGWPVELPITVWKLRDIKRRQNELGMPLWVIRRNLIRRRIVK